MTLNLILASGTQHHVELDDGGYSQPEGAPDCPHCGDELRLGRCLDAEGIAITCASCGVCVGALVDPKPKASPAADPDNLPW